ncbi:hypothetical protein pdam_00010876, partial [Pocillopora damicornis]
MKKRNLERLESLQVNECSDFLRELKNLQKGFQTLEASMITHVRVENQTPGQTHYKSYLTFGPLSRNQNGSRHDQGPGMRAEIVGSNNTAIDSSAASFSSAEIFPTNSQASISFKFSSLNIRPWNVESLGSTNNSHLALMQGVARATVQMNRRMREREQ